jgi:hypothetical protein
MNTNRITAQQSHGGSKELRKVFSIPSEYRKKNTASVDHRILHVQKFATPKGYVAGQSGRDFDGSFR